MKTLLRLILCFIPGFILVTGSLAQRLTPDAINSRTQNQDSLPDGVSRDWLNSLNDENGNRIIPEDPEIDALQRKVFNGPTVNSNYGFSVSSAGDVNGDEFDDIIVGAFGYNTNTGRVYIYYGGLNMNTIADVIMTGEAAGNLFGTSATTAGDVNGDGYSDVIVGAQAYNSNTGRAYIFFGGTSMNNVADIIMTGETAGIFFGRSVSTAGDVNGDGYSDVIAGAYGYNTITGKAFIFFGGAAMDNAADITMTGETTNNSFGYSVSTAGDVNGDGYSDVIAGAFGYSTNTGRAYIFFGGSSMNSVADVTMTGESISNAFGRSVSTAGDVNGDGYSDVIIGAYTYNLNTGRAYIFYGDASMNNVEDVTLKGETTNNFFGISVSTAGDINGDGYSDVIIGATGHSSNTGKTYIYFGGVSMNSVTDITMTGEAAGNNFAFSVSAAGDVNGDGYSDVIVGAYSYGGSTGRVYLFDYFMKNEIIPEIAMTGEAINSSFGGSVCSAGDVNGDGYTDLIIGAPIYGSVGRAYIFFGGPLMDNVADVTMTGDSTNSNFGRSGSTAGDVNGDGYSDVIIGVPNTGRAFIFFGGVSMDNVIDITMTGEVPYNNFGYSVSTAGDVNGDGYSDVIAGASGYSTYTGRAYIFFGGSSMNNVADVTMTGEAASTYFGSSVSTTGDVNGDGYSDVIVGAYASLTGRAFIFFGGSLMDSIADLTMTGEATNDNFGFSVSAARDVNGDGYSDVIVGAYGYSSQSGRAYIFFGGASMNNAADIMMSGIGAGSDFGFSVSTAGDVNRDGYSDVIVGAPGYGSSGKRAYIFFGGASMNSSVDVTVTGEGDQMGSSVSTAGDLNGDGYSDVISGAPSYGSLVGRAYVYIGSAISVKPILLRASDVPDDQGGYLNLKFAKSAFDVALSDRGGINYQMERSVPPGINGYQWISIGTVLGTYNSFYTSEIHTPLDSGVSGNNTYFFRITAVSITTGEFWRSNIMSGYSIDNLAPVAPQNLAAAPDNNSIYLNWNQSTENDFHHYGIYRDGIEIATSINNSFDDLTVLEDSTYDYQIAAIDVHGNISPLSNLVNITFNNSGTLNLTILMEGFYDASLNKMRISDTLTIYLRNTSSPFTIVDSSKAIIDDSTFSGSFQIANATTGTYYIQTKHRHSIETWSASGISYTEGATVSYNFTTSNSLAFGNNMILVDQAPIRFGIYSGDVNQDGVVDATDLALIDNDATNFTSGYVNTDLTGDDFVDASDAAIADNNAFNFVGKISP